MNIYWTARSRNRKTGDVPTAWIGHGIDGARASCSGCPLLDTVCYAHGGRAAANIRGVSAAVDRGADRTLASALADRAPTARMARLTAIGDIGRSGREVADRIVDTIWSAGLAVVGYTHHWREAPVADAWKGRLMASCDTLADADRAVDEGWRAAVVLPAGSGDTVTPAGRKVSVCPAIRTDGRIKCNDCRLCDGSRKGKAIVGFPAHGARKRAFRGEA